VDGLSTCACSKLVDPAADVDGLDSRSTNGTCPGTEPVGYHLKKQNNNNNKSTLA
jgi:hypothetical protein